MDSLTFARVGDGVQFQIFKPVQHRLIGFGWHAIEGGLIAIEDRNREAAEHAERYRQAGEARAHREKEQAARIEALFESHPEVMGELGAAARALDYVFSSVFLRILTAKEARHAD